MRRRTAQQQKYSRPAFLLRRGVALDQRNPLHLVPVQVL
jgi:hypothetical protein